MSALFLLLACGGGETPAGDDHAKTEAPAPDAEPEKAEEEPGKAEEDDAPKELTLEPYMQTCMGSGDCMVAIGCCNQGAVAVNKANHDEIQKQLDGMYDCSTKKCEKQPLPEVSCEAAKCTLAP